MTEVIGQSFFVINSVKAWESEEKLLNLADQEKSQETQRPNVYANNT